MRMGADEPTLVMRRCPGVCIDQRGSSPEKRTWTPSTAPERSHSTSFLHTSTVSRRSVDDSHGVCSHCEQACHITSHRTELMG